MTRKHLSRRTILRGIGASVAVPFLDAMMPAFAAPVEPKSPCRIVFAYVPNGIHMPYWTPEAEGADFALPRTLAPLAEYKEDILLLSGLMQNNGRALGDGPGDHARAAASYLTGVHPRKTAGTDISAGVSVDQIAAEHIGTRTRFASLEFGCEDGRLVGNCDSGYSCAYSNSISWRTPSAPNPVEINPRLVFERLFGSPEDGDAAARARRLRNRKSVLDYVTSDTESLKITLGATDQRKLDEYLSGVRDIERRIEAAEKTPAEPTDFERPAGVPPNFGEHAKLMFDLMALALQTDATRVATFLVAREGSTHSYREIGILDAHHPLTHHRNDPAMIEKVAQINGYHVELFASFLKRLKETPDGDGTLLDHTMVLYGSGLSDGNKHQHDDLPVLLAGRGCGTFKPGRHVRVAKETPMANLFLSMLDGVGVNVEKLGDSNGKLELLST